MYSVGLSGAACPTRCAVRLKGGHDDGQQLPILRKRTRFRCWKETIARPLRCDAYDLFAQLAEAVPAPSQVPLWVSLVAPVAILGGALVNFTMIAIDTRSKVERLNETLKQEMLEQKISLAESNSKTTIEAVESRVMEGQKLTEGKLDNLEMRLTNSQGLVQAKMEILGKAIDGVEESLEIAIDGVKSMKTRLDRLEKMMDTLKEMEKDVVPRLAKLEDPGEKN